MCGSFLTLLTAVVEVDGTRMARTSIWDQFVCRVWLTRISLWAVLVTSTYGILATAMERYIAVIYPIWYKVGTKKNNLYDFCVITKYFLIRVGLQEGNAPRQIRV